MTAHPYSKRFVCSGFTLVESLVVLAVIGVIASILIPVVGRVRESANQASCLSNLRQLSSLYLLYTNDHNGYLLNASEGVQGGTYWQFELQEFMEADMRERQMDGFHCASCLAQNPGLDDGRDILRSTYGLNNFIGRENDSDWAIDMIQQAVNPSKTILFADPAMESERNTMVGIGYEASLFPVSYHNDDMVNMSFLDGHVESRPHDEIPTSGDVWPRGRDGSIFWKGW